MYKENQESTQNVSIKVEGEIGQERRNKLSSCLKFGGSIEKKRKRKNQIRNRHLTA
jgi:hypothetical protein